MRIEVLYVAECPTHAEAVSLVRGVLAAKGVTAEVQEILVTDEAMARDLRFRGSPTIRVDGRDVVVESGEPEVASLCCRLYANSNRLGVPPSEAVSRAVSEAQGGKRR
ncbi:MAG TPA: DUF2703 domain-containing protein [Candidatus Acidoferrum sp.]|nr:DUF2703 domain-containing protein [Candidatus Acidoferrum sp.]